jgi:hypothetical protein
MAAFRTRDLHGLPFALVFLVAASGVGFAVVRSDHWLRGVGVVGVAMLIAALLRVVLTDRQAGMLAIRRRPFDVLCYLVVAVAIIGTGLVLPH